jgi:flagellar basal body-associated protein FliL
VRVASNQGLAASGLMIRHTFKRKPKKRVAARSVRLPPEVDKALDKEARRKGWSKSLLIRDILISWLTFQKAHKIHSGEEE